MGLSWSSSSNNNRRRNNNYFQNPTPTPLITSYTSDLSPIPPLPPPPNYNVPYPTPPYPPPPNSYPTPLPPHPPLPPPHQPYYYQYSNGYNNSCGFMGPPMLGRSNFSPHYANLNNGWPGIRPFEAPPRPPVPPPPHVENQMAKKIRNDVNVHKDTIKIVADENNPDCHLVSFTFDALVDGSITIFYFAKEESDCIFTPLYPEVYTLVRIPFHKGRGQKFCQPSGTGIDLGFFELDDLSKPSPTEDVFPLVIFAETCSSPFPTDEHLGQPQPTSSNAQITQAIIEKNNDNPFQAKVVKQILWVDRVRYELRDIYGIGNSAQAGFDSNEPANCVICMSEPKDTAVMPCRHMCMCSGCSKVLRLRTNKCPICRQPIEELLEIKVNNGDR